ncbi:hypothetical protein HDU98_002237 [Podochytrium sp. JEL0797]|nr:hypothetical protein HDU98_002237 [Podochytrium sp. JEL0797]
MEKWNDFAESYSEWSPKQTLSYAIEALDCLCIGNEPCKILDLATGDGVFALEAARRHTNSSIIAIDYSQAMIDILDQRIKQQKLENISTHVGTAEALDFPDNHFDYVAVVFGLFLMEDGVKCLNEIHRVLKPGGKLVFTTWATTFLSDLLLASLMVANPIAAFERVVLKCTNVARNGTWNNPAWIREACLSRAQFQSAEITVVSHPTHVEVSEIDSFVRMLAGGPGVQSLMRVEGWVEDDASKVTKGLRAALGKMFEGGKEQVELVSSAHVVLGHK